MSDPSYLTKLALCVVKHHAKKVLWGSGGIAPRFLKVGTRFKVSSHIHAPPLNPRGKSPGTHWIGGGVSSRVCLDAVAKRKITASRNRIPVFKLVTLPLCWQSYPEHY
jgi:hypothetical protein